MRRELLAGLVAYAALAGCRGDLESKSINASSPGSVDGGADREPTNNASDPTGDWSVMYGAPAVVTIVRAGNSYEVRSKGNVQVTGAACSLPSGTLIATFSGEQSPYMGTHGLWSTGDCSFQRWKDVDFSLAGDRLTADLFAVQDIVTFVRIQPSLGARPGSAPVSAL